MRDLVELFREGGVWSYLMLLLILAGLGVAAAGLGLQSFGRRPPGALWLVVPALVALVGLLGMLFGIGEAGAALAFAAPEMRSLLMAKGISISLGALLVAGVGVSLLGLLGALGIGLGSVISAGPAAQLRPLHLSVAAGGVAVVVVGAGVGAVGFGTELGLEGFAPPLLALLAGGGVVMASLRASSALEWEGRSAANIAAAGACAAASLLGFALFAWASYSRLGFNALALAAPESRDLLWASAQRAIAQGGLLALATAGGLGLTALGVSALDGARALSGRNPLRAGLMVIPLLVIVGTAAFGVARVSALVGDLLGS